jgi:hypothetical protein
MRPPHNLTLCVSRGARSARRALNAFKFEPDAWRRFIHFSSGKYTRNLVVYEKQFSVLLLCWARCERPVPCPWSVGGGGGLPEMPPL